MLLSRLPFCRLILIVALGDAGHHDIFQVGLLRRASLSRYSKGRFFFAHFRPFTRFYILPFGGRSTAVRLSTGDVWVLASTPLTPDTKVAIDKLGPVK
jgi:hypothetical protein